MTWLVDWYRRRFGFWAKNNRKIAKDYNKILESGGSSLDPELQAKVYAAIDEYKKPYTFGKKVIDTDEARVDLLDELVRYLHTRFDNNGWNENQVFDRLPAWYRHAYLAFALDGEVQNGGLGQYFANSAGEHASDTVLALNEMGAETLAPFLEAAIKVNQEYIKLESENAEEDEYFECDKKLSVLDDQYYSGLDKVLYEAAENYIKQQMKLSGDVSFAIPSA